MKIMNTNGLVISKKDLARILGVSTRVITNNFQRHRIDLAYFLEETLGLQITKTSYKSMGAAFYLVGDPQKMNGCIGTAHHLSRYRSAKYNAVALTVFAEKYKESCRNYEQLSEVATKAVKVIRGSL